MGWLDEWWPSKDPRNDLDPSLRSFLEKSSPRPYETGKASLPSSRPEQSYREQLGLSSSVGPEGQQKAQEQALNAARQKTDTENDEDRPLPKESLFPDGRYKHLWKTYRPQTERENEGKSDQEKLMDIVDAFRERQAEVKRAASENCADESLALRECFTSGGWRARMGMCRTENRRYLRCLEMQGRFLRAVGYLTMNERSEGESEAMQMHADLLYHRMMDHERAVEEAKESGLPPPPMPPLLDSVPSTKDIPHYSKPVTFADLPPQLQENLAYNRLRGLEGFELELAKKELDHYIAINQELVVRMRDRYQTEYEERQMRREEGRERWGDMIKRYFDFRKYDDSASKDGTASGRAEQEKGE